jgi:Domain of unknown function (DUF4249)
MKKISLYLIIFILGIFILGCEENFSPKTNFVQKYALNCVVRGDTSFQAASISMSYDVSGYDPNTNHNDPFLSGAQIRIWDGKNNVYFFRDSSVVRADTTRYDTPFHFYYLDGFQPKALDSLEILAILPDGKQLHAYTRVPQAVEFSLDSTMSDKLVPVSGKSDFTESWLANINTGWYLPRLSLYYRKLINGTEVSMNKEIPLKYETVNGKLEAQYPKPARLNNITYQDQYLDSVMVQISIGDQNKSHYRIMAAILDIIVFDDNLSKYYSSMNGYYDDYTVRVDVSDYSNIIGGFGIFGSYIKVSKLVNITKNYIHSFGYKAEGD